MILVFGSKGQLASELLCKNSDIVCLGREKCDLLIEGAGYNAVKTLAPAAVINAAAFTAVDLAETEFELAYRLNADLPRELAQACAEINIPFIHVSSEYVFGGDCERPWSETDSPAPINKYGASKLKGEQCISETDAVYAIIRTSWVFSQFGQNFVKKIISVAKERQQLNIVNDQIGGPTPAADLASVCLKLVNELNKHPQKKGIYNFSGKPDVSWSEFAEAIFRYIDKSPKIIPISSNEFLTPAKRPLNSRLNCDKIFHEFGIPRPDWNLELKKVVKTVFGGRNE